MNDGGGDGAGCFDIKEWADTTELTNVEVSSHTIVTYSDNPKPGFAKNITVLILL